LSTVALTENYYGWWVVQMFGNQTQSTTAASVWTSLDVMAELHGLKVSLTEEPLMFACFKAVVVREPL
jgi:hypothetical protein